jgi:hypothetical protein
MEISDIGLEKYSSDAFKQFIKDPFYLEQHILYLKKTNLFSSTQTHTLYRNMIDEHHRPDRFTEYAGIYEMINRHYRDCSIEEKIDAFRGIIQVDYLVDQHVLFIKSNYAWQPISKG